MIPENQSGLLMGGAPLVGALAAEGEKPYPTSRWWRLIQAKRLGEADTNDFVGDWRSQPNIVLLVF